MSVLAPRGFVASATAAGIKADGQLDLALVASESAEPVAVGATFTSNLLAGPRRFRSVEPIWPRPVGLRLESC